MSRLFRKFICMCLSFVIAAALPLLAGASEVPTDTADAADATDHSEAIELLVMLGLIEGYSDGNYNLDRTITRAEAVALISRALWGGEDDSGLYIDGNPGGYTDIDQHWSAGYINYCTALGIFSGVGNGLARPDAPIRMAELCKMALVALGYSPDFEGYTGANWSAEIISDAITAGLLDRLESAPLDYVSRGDAFELLKNLLYANVVVYVRGTAIFVPASFSVTDYVGGHVGSSQTGTDASSWRTFGMEYLDFVSVTGVLWANAYALLDGAPEQYTYASFSTSPNGVTTFGGLIYSRSGEWFELDSISPPLELVGRAVSAEFASGKVLSVRASGSTVEYGAEYMSEGNVIPLNLPVYVNYSLSSNGRDDIYDAIADGCGITFISNDGDRMPDLVLIDRNDYAGKLTSIGTIEYPGYGVACEFSEAGIRYSNYIIGEYAPGMYMSIRQVGLYSFVEPIMALDPSPDAEPTTGVALITSIYCSVEENDISVGVHAFLESGEHGNYRVSYVLSENEVVSTEDFGAEMTAEELARTLTGMKSLKLGDNGSATGLSALVAYGYTENGELVLSPSLDCIDAKLSDTKLTVYADYETGAPSLGIGDDGRERYVGSETVLFIEGPNGWEVYHGTDMPALVRQGTLVRLNVAYSNMFSLGDSDWLQIRALAAPDGSLSVAGAGDEENG